MSEEQNQGPQQQDFFSDLMFGRPPMPPNESKQHASSEQPQHDDASEVSQENQNEEQKKPSTESGSNEQGDQLMQIIALVQSLSPYLAKLAPLASKVSTFFNQEEDEKDSSSKTTTKNAKK
ncbi:hypothetical protein JCM9140_1250 [Halalkalibacter wakoensis JCM 9140]|uniref:Uncharacterized protein n=1 Tax=Halalkalibacter wakoensis JCM 9140 TaxID=1236970 RepID=W4Q0L5_9BACI|nr:hypothetical protein [Halalkalibacter wakoensis]GAE25268.1 hypothetical protein JCM9140_1250 [Halalkalibacter wakoensis JCM 9140]